MSKTLEFLSQFTVTESMDILDSAARRGYGADKEKTAKSRERHSKVKRNADERQKVAMTKPASITVRLPSTHKAYVRRLVDAMRCETMSDVIIDLIEREARSQGWLDAQD